MLTAPTSLERLTDGIAHTRHPNRTARGHELRESRSHARRGDPRTSVAEAAVRQERARLARELHDTVAQTLYAITLSASRARTLLQRDDGSQVQLVIDDLLQLASGGQAELRTLLTDMRATSGDLVSGLKDLAAEARARNALDVRLSLSGDAKVPPAIGDALVMITREALHNVAKHASSGRVDVSLEVDSRELCLTVADHGPGFDPAVPRPGHFGLQSMCERAAVVGGTIELSSAVGVGTRVRVRIPAQIDSDG